LGQLTSFEASGFILSLRYQPISRGGSLREKSIHLVDDLPIRHHHTQHGFKPLTVLRLWILQGPRILIQQRNQGGHHPPLPNRLKIAPQHSEDVNDVGRRCQWSQIIHPSRKLFFIQFLQLSNDELLSSVDHRFFSRLHLGVELNDPTGRTGFNQNPTL